MIRGIFAAAFTAALAGCASMGQLDKPGAVATLEPTAGNSTRGTVTFTQRGDIVRVNARVSGLKPNVEHGFHLHENGDCSSGDGMSAGGHFNPAGKPHGSQATEHHAGDIPNLRSDASGNASATYDLTGVSIGSGSDSIVGRGMIVHRDPDDYKSQPAGNAGPRLACGVVAKGAQV
jgi:Cu-Zn family superoxide dismutase